MGKLIDQYKQIHSRKRYGVSASTILPYFEGYIKQLNPKSVLDYGCGQGNLTSNLPYIPVRVQYDPAIAKYDTLPKQKFDLVINTDVLEHVPEDELDELLTTMSSYSSNAVIAVCLRIAAEILPNGMNAHCTVKPLEWWRNLLLKHYGKVDIVRANVHNGTAIFKTF